MPNGPTVKSLPEHAVRIIGAQQRLRDEMAKVAAEVAAQKGAPPEPQKAS